MTKRKNFKSIKALLNFLDAFQDATGIRIPWEQGTELEYNENSPVATFLAGWDNRVAVAMKETACMDCNKDNFGYMVKTPVWRVEAGLDRRILCWGCLEKRIGRSHPQRPYQSPNKRPLVCRY